MSTIRVTLTRTKPLPYLLAALVALVIADGVITNILIGAGLAHEGNPFLRGLAGGAGFLVIKAAAAIGCALLLADLSRRRARLARVSIYGLLVFYGAVVGWNFLLLLLGWR